MKQYLIPILAILVLTSGLAVSCGQSREPIPLDKDKPSWTEKQVIDYLYEHLVSKAGQQPEMTVKAKVIIIGWRFRNALLQANKETLEEDDIDEWGELVERESKELISPPAEMLAYPGIFTGALRRLAQYDENGWWSVSIAGEWRINEKTGEVIAWNEEATKLLEDISHNTFHNNTYKYHIDYPTDWTIKQIGDEGKILIMARERQVDIAIDEPRKLEREQSLGQVASGFTAFLSTVYQDLKLISLVRLENGDYQAEYEWMVGGTEIYSRTYFVLHNSWFYMISCSAPKSTYESYLDEFEYAYNSFGFD